MTNNPDGLSDARARQDRDPESPCTDCYDTGLTIQTKRACYCDAGDRFRIPPASTSTAIAAGEDGKQAFRSGAAWAVSFQAVRGRAPDLNDVDAVFAAAAPKAASEDGATEFDRACERSWDATHRVLWRHASEQQRANWAVGICAALAASPTDATGADMAAFGASDAACYLYPGEDQQAERSAFCAGAAHAVGNLPVAGETL